MPIKKLKKTIENFPGQFRKIATRGVKKKFTRVPEKIVICGMGGSGLPAELIQLFPSRVPIKARKNYAPKNFPKKSGVICISYSGNTEETLSCYKKAQKEAVSVLAITTGGKLAKEAQKDNNLIQIPQTNIQPRWATGLLFSALYLTLKNSEVLPQAPKKEDLQKLPELISPPEFKEEAKAIASFLEKKIPLIYTSTSNRPLGYYWKIAINENTKRHAFNNVFPEFNHNEIEGYKHQADKFKPLIIKAKDDSPKIKKRMSKFKEVLTKRGIKTKTVTLNQETSLEKLASSIIITNWTVYQIAKKNNLDPEPVQLIEQFKKLMKN